MLYARKQTNDYVFLMYTLRGKQTTTNTRHKLYGYLTIAQIILCKNLIPWVLERQFIG